MRSFGLLAPWTLEGFWYLTQVAVQLAFVLAVVAVILFVLYLSVAGPLYYEGLNKQLSDKAQRERKRFAEEAEWRDKVIALLNASIAKKIAQAFDD